MTILQTYDEETTKETTIFDIDIIKFHLEYTSDNGEIVVITEADLKKYYSIKILGMNDKWGYYEVRVQIIKGLIKK